MGDDSKYYWLRVVIECIGWLYFFLWTFSFYPQVWHNFRRESVAGLSISYEMLNMVSFTSYFIFNAACFAHSERAVRVNDLAFSIHAFLLMIVIMTQMLFIYRPRKETLIKGTQQMILETQTLWEVLLSMSKVTSFFICVCILLGFYNVLLSLFGYLRWGYDFYSTVFYFGLIKDLIVWVKCIPQLFIHWRDQSTQGFAIGGVILDLAGGLCALLQQCLMAYNFDDMRYVYGNIPKLLLSIESIFFDVMFLIQHYVLYPHSHSSYHSRHKRTDSFHQRLASY